jgi:hypothetical protein
MGKSGQTVLIIGVFLLLLSFVIVPLESAVCRSSVDNPITKLFTGILCGFTGLFSKWVLTVIAWGMIGWGLLVSVCHGN